LVAAAPLAFAMAVAWWWYARDRPGEHASVNARELAFVVGDRPPVEPPLEPGAWRRVAADRQVLLLTASNFCSNYVFYFFFNWLFVYLVSVRGFASLEGGLLSAAPWIAGAVGAAVGGHLCDRLVRRWGAARGYHAMPIIGLTVAALCIVAAALAQDPYTAVVLLSLCLGFQQLTEGAFWGAATAMGGRYAATACGVLNTGGNVVGGLGALLVPLVAGAFGWAASVASGAAFALAGALLWLFIHPDRIVRIGDMPEDGP
jgi:ACS family glucarate transporter-like MFS transporter